MKIRLSFLLAMVLAILSIGSVSAGTLSASQVKLSDLEPYSKRDMVCDDAYQARYTEDNFHNQYMDGGILYTKSGAYETGYIEYYLDGEYAVLSGTLFVPYVSRETDGEISSFRIYGDDKLLYDGPGLAGRDKAVDFAVNVEGVSFLKIVGLGGWFKGDGSGVIPVMCAGNLILDKENRNGVSKNNSLPDMFLSELEAYSYNNTYNGSAVYDYVHDDFGKGYSSAVYNGYFGIVSNDDTEDSYVEYYLDGQYSRLTGVAYVPKCSRAVSSPVQSPCLNIYADDVLVKQIVLSGKDKPVNIDVNIGNADFVKIEVFGGWFEGNGMGMVPMMCAADLAVYR